jgi:hypothetical protein
MTDHHAPRGWLIGSLLFLAATFATVSCRPRAAEAAEIASITGSGDTLRILIRWRVTQAAPESVTVGLTSIPPKGALPGRRHTGPWALGVWQWDTLTWIPQPALAEGETITITACLTAYRASLVVGPVCGPPANYTRPIITPGLEVDSTQVIGLIAVPESGWVRPPATMVRNTWDPICAPYQQAGATVCMADVEMTRCERYLNGAQVGGLGMPMDRAVGVSRLAKPVLWQDPSGRPYQMGGVGYAPDGTPHPECAGYLPPVCLVADLVDGSKVLTRESWGRPRCRQELYRAMMGPSGPFRWLRPDSTRYAAYSTRYWETAVAHRAAHVHEPIGLGRPGVPGYASLRPGPAYPIGLCPCVDTLRAVVGQAIPLGLRVRMSDGTMQWLTDTAHVFVATRPGPTSYIGQTPWGLARVVVMAASPGASPSLARRTS